MQGKKSSFLFFTCTETGTWVFTDVKLKYIQSSSIFLKGIVYVLLKLPWTNFFIQGVLLSLPFYCKYWQKWIFPSCTHLLTGSESPVNVLGTGFDTINILSGEFKKECLKNAKNCAEENSAYYIHIYFKSNGLWKHFRAVSFILRNCDISE